jgi:hypothetical protein
VLLVAFVLVVEFVLLVEFVSDALVEVEFDEMTPPGVPTQAQFVRFGGISIPFPGMYVRPIGRL